MSQMIINASELASDGKLSKIGSFQLIQNAITELMGDLKIDGFSVREKYNAFWVFTKTRAKFLKEVAWKEKITITSFISSITASKMSIDVEIKNQDNEIVIYSRTELCALNIASQRIMKLSSLGIDNTMVKDYHPLEIVFTKFITNDLSLVDEVKVRYTNIDFVHHTNNLEYIRLIMNTYSVEEMESRNIKEIEIIYINQSHENDILQIKKKSEESKDLFLIEKAGTTVVQCEIVY